MMAVRRDRRRPLIRSNAIVTALARNGMIRQSHGQKSEQQNSQAAVMKAAFSEAGHAQIQKHDAYTSQLELSRYLRQLSSLHAAGVLTDDEFATAKGRLFGS